MLATLQDKSPKNLSEGKAQPAQAAEPAQSPDKIWSDLMDGNKRFVAGQLNAANRGQNSRVADQVTTPESHGAELLR